MKTNQVMVRPMGEFEVTQRTSDGFFNATALLKQWNEANGNNQKHIKDYLRLKETKEFVKALMEEPEFKDGNSHLLENADYKGIAKGENNPLLENADYKDFPKSIIVVTRGKNGGTWMTPLMFLDFAMWLNPAFKVKVLKFVQDEMIKFRNEAGDNYREMAAAVQRIVSRDFMPTAIKKVGEALNWIVFNQHEKMMRNKSGDENKQRELAQLEKKVADLINEGFIANFDSLINYLRRQYHTRNVPKIFIAN